MPERTIPKWISIVTSLIAMLGLFVGGSLYVAPGKFIPNTDFSIKSVRFLALMWATRQIAIAFILGYSVLRKSAPMLQVAFIAYILMTGQDAMLGVYEQDMGLVAGSSIACALASVMLFVLTRKESGQ